MRISQDVLEKIKLLPLPRSIAVSGFGGSGKSSFAKELGAVINAPVISVDSFQKDGAFDTGYMLWEIMDFSRLEKEVLRPFWNKEETIRYGHFTVPARSVSETMEISNMGRVIVEGVGLFRPELMRYFSCTIWMDCPIEEATARGKKRDREEYHSPQDELWDGIWKENDLQYYETYKPREMADYIVSNA